jgi:hypothetical protein
VGETGTRDTDNAPLENFVLSDVLGVDFIDVSDTSTCYLRVIQKIEAYGVPAMDIHVMSSYVRIKATAARTLIELVPPYEGIKTGTPPPALHTEGPGITINSYGRGKAIYCAPDIFKAYYTEDTPVLRKLALGLISFIYPTEKRTIFLENAPVNVEMFYNKRGNERFVHMVNYSGDKRETGIPQTQDFPVIYGIKAHVKLDNAPEGISSIPEGTKIEFAYKDGWVTFEAEPLKIHSVYLIET